MKEVFLFEDLYEAYVDCCKHKRSTANCCDYMIDYPENLYDLWNELNDGSYSVGKSIAFVIHYPKDREIFAANFRDRIVHHLIGRRLMPFLEQEFIEDSYSCMAGRGTSRGIRRCARGIDIVSEGGKKEAYILKGDFRNFFMTIDKRIVYDKICRLLDKYDDFDEETESAWKTLIRKVVFNNPRENCTIVGDWHDFRCLPYGKSLFDCDAWHGIPIGNLTSQLFANLLLSDFDWFVEKELGFSFYGRYVDDFYIICESKERLLRAMPKIKEYLKEIGIELHPKKVSVSTIEHGIGFLGSTIKAGRVLAGKRTKTNFLSEIRNCSERISNRTSNTECIEKFVKSMNSYIGVFRQTNSYNFRKKFLSERIFGTISEHVVVNPEKTKVIMRKHTSSF